MTLPGWLADNRPLFHAAGIVGAAGLLLHIYGWPVLRFVGFWDTYAVLLLTAVVAVVLRLLITRLQVGIRETRPGWARTWTVMRRDYLNRDALLRSLVGLLLCGFLGTLFLGWKHLIPDLVPFYLDPHLEHWDIWLHGGRAPWDWLRALNGPVVAYALDQVYYSVNWAPVIVVAWVVTSRHPLRNRFLLALIVVWFGLGSVMATVLSSAGPIYAAESFAAQEAYLRSVPGLITPRAWDTLLRVHQNGAGHPYAAISAMPSLHVAMPALVVFAGWSRYPPIIWPGLAYLVLTLASTVYLGWHYALDGYVSIIAVGVFWWISGRRDNSHPPRSSR